MSRQISNQTRLGALFWVLTVEFFIAQFIAQSAFTDYSLLLEDISNLGVTRCDRINPASGVLTCSPLHLVFNAGIFINGVLVVLGVWLTRQFWPRSGRTTIALWIIAVGGGLGCMIVGLFPVNENEAPHVVGAILALLVSCGGIALLGTVMWRSSRGFALYSIASALLCITGFVLYALAVSQQIEIGRGLAERITAWPQNLWYMVTGTLILTHRISPRKSPRA
ncbi:DUF998 domain-containing protein [Devosia sp.]|uniref:DUF998 domain-containing protein n=1 Tax=Devosia sp. TaxID=1871048 RepID=UPI003A8F3FEC